MVYLYPEYPEYAVNPVQINLKEAETWH